jgi:hypothetical protein
VLDLGGSAATTRGKLFLCRDAVNLRTSVLAMDDKGGDTWYLWYSVTLGWRFGNTAPQDDDTIGSSLC